VTLRKLKFRRRTATLSAATAVLVASVVSIGVAGAPSGAASSSGLAAAQAFLAKFTAVPTSIGENIPLKKVPPRGVKVIFLNTANATAATLDGGFTQAAQALGWKPTIVTYSAEPGTASEDALNLLASWAATADREERAHTPNEG